jgi:hypothetical protein
MPPKAPKDTYIIAIKSLEFQRIPCSSYEDPAIPKDAYIVTIQSLELQSMGHI